MLCRRYRPLTAEGLCDECRELMHPIHLAQMPPFVDSAVCAVGYNYDTRPAVSLMKQGDSVYFRYFAEHIEIPDEWRVELLVPMPVHPMDFFLKGGFSPAEELSQKLSVLYGIPSVGRMVRKLKRTPQQKSKDALERASMGFDVFEASPFCEGMTVAIVDDLCVTGTTLSRCAYALKQAGAKRVFAICAAIRRDYE